MSKDLTGTNPAYALAQHLRQAAAEGQLPVDSKRIHVGPPDSLDAARADAEAALPVGWLLGLVARDGQYVAEAWEDDEAYASGDAAEEAFADAATLALRALAERLRERTG